MSFNKITSKIVYKTTSLFIECFFVIKFWWRCRSFDFLILFWRKNIFCFFWRKLDKPVRLSSAHLKLIRGIKNCTSQLIPTKASIQAIQIMQLITAKQLLVKIHNTQCSNIVKSFFQISILAFQAVIRKKQFKCWRDFDEKMKKFYK